MIKELKKKEKTALSSKVLRETQEHGLHVHEAREKSSQQKDP